MIFENYWKILVSLVVTLALAVASLIVARKMKMMAAPEGKLLKVVESTRLDQRTSVFLLEIDGERLLVGTTQAGNSITMMKMASREQLQ